MLTSHYLEEVEALASRVVVIDVAIAPYLPTGAAVRLMWAAVGDFGVQPASVAALVGWTAAFAGVAAWSYRRDEGRRFS